MVKNKNKKKSQKKEKDKKKKSALRSDTKKGIVAVVFFMLALLSLLSFLGSAGIFGQYFTKISRLLFGKGYFFLSISFIMAGLSVVLPRLSLKKKVRPSYQAVFFGMLIFVLSVLGVFHVLGQAGGYMGLIFGYPLLTFFGVIASMVVLLSFLIISFLIVFNLSLIPAKKDEEEFQQEPLVAPDQQEQPEPDKKKSLWQKIASKAEDFKPVKKEKPVLEQQEVEGDQLIGGAAAEKNSKKAVALASLTKTDVKFKAPPFEFLEKDKGQPTSGDIKANINIIKRTLENFGLQVEMAEVNVGPTVTQYTLRPAQGIKLAKITSLQNDLALALAAHPLRIEAPIPGRSLVGIEIPNRSTVIVRLRGLLERPTFQESDSALTFALGRDVAGNPIFADLAKMPHLLVAGATGAGKTVSLNNILLSLLYRNSPARLNFILIDPKRVELTTYNDIPHLITPVIVQSEKAVGALRWAVAEMERRFQVLQSAGKRDIAGYNVYLASLAQKKNKDEADGVESLPYIVVLIDELADLMASYGREAEAAIVRLAQMSRAVGIHLIVSTQRPSVEVITGLIKANITSRMAFQVASQIDSRTILDMAGAEKLLGNGDMLFLAGNSAKPRRVQGAFVAEKEAKKVADYLRELKEPEYKEELESGYSEPGVKTGGLAGAAGSESHAEDELYEQAKTAVVQAKKASASLLQRRLRVGYARAARLLDILEENGVVGPADGARPRDVFVDEGADKPIE